MIFDIDECEQLSSLAGKTTVVTATSQSPIEFLMWSVFSFLIRTEPGGFLEHINIVINGADERTGSTELQDTKQRFLEDLRKLKWVNKDKTISKDMPITVVRVWSRLGADQATEMGIAWVHTDSYVIAHDDVIVLPGWDEASQKLYSDDNIALVHGKTTRLTNFNSTQYMGENKLGFPHMSAHFLLCRKAAIAKLGVRWAGYHIKSKFTISEDILNNNPTLNPALVDKTYSYINQDFGSWVYHKIRQHGYKMESLDKDVAFHFGGASWANAAGLDKARHIGRPFVESLERELQQFPEYWELYRRYKPCG